MLKLCLITYYWVTSGNVSTPRDARGEGAIQREYSWVSYLVQTFLLTELSLMSSSMESACRYGKGGHFKKHATT